MLVEPVTAAMAEHGEGPVWWPGWGGLRWVDMLAGDVLHLDDDGAVHRWHVGTVAALIRPRRDGGVVVVTEHDVVLADRPGGSVTVLASPIDDPGVRFNEGSCCPRGTLYAGSMAYDADPGRGRLYRIGADGEVTVTLDAVTISNGLAFTADGRRAFYADTPTGRVDTFDVDGSGALQDRRPFVTVPADAGSPDGLTVDSEGGVWVALWGGSAVRRYDEDGALAEVVALPVDQVTACTFGGADLDELYVTTSRHGQPRPHPLAGAVFRMDAGVSGLPVVPFAG